MEGAATFFFGIFGTCGSVTSYSENKSCMYSAFIMIFIFDCEFSAMPCAIIGGVLFIIYGIITAVEISIVQLANMEKSRNLFVVGVSLFSGLYFSEYFKLHPEELNLGIQWLDQLIIILITNSLTITMIVAFFLDNTIKCKEPKDRSLDKFIQMDDELD